MSPVFVDTSAILALMVTTDRAHPAAVAAFENLRRVKSRLVTSSHVLLETYALISRRLGLSAVDAFRHDFAPLIEVVWVDHDLHERALDGLLRDGRSGLSLVDAASFIVACERQVEAVFAYDRHFSEAGFELV